MNHDQFSAAIEAIYETPGAPERWPDALELIGRCFGAKGATLIGARDGLAPLTVVSPALVEAQVAYAQSYWQTDFLLTRVPNMIGAGISEHFVDTDVASPLEIETAPFYTAFRRQFGIGRCVGTEIQPGAIGSFYLVAQRDARFGDLAGSDKALMAQIARHAERALSLDGQLDQGHMTAQALADALSVIRCAAILLDDLGRVMFANMAAQTLLDIGPKHSGEKLCFDRAEQSAALAASLEAARAPHVATSPNGGKSFIVRPPGDDRAIVVHFVPLGKAANRALVGSAARPHALLLAFDPTMTGAVDAALVRDYLKLTLGEARLASLIGSGLSPRDAARRLNITEETARTVLKTVFGKTGITR
jgi:DNA-binding CsgD family transcriptional regulator